MLSQVSLYSAITNLNLTFTNVSSTDIDFYILKRDKGIDLEIKESKTIKDKKCTN